MTQKPTLTAWFAAAVFCVALLLAGIGVPEYSPLLHPVGLRGTTGLPGAQLFNLGAFVLPGMALLWVAQTMRAALAAAGWTARLGLTLAQGSALAFALQGVLQMDPLGMAETSSRLHVLMWMLWWLAFVPAMLLLATGARRRKGFAMLCLLAGVLVPLLAVFAPIGAWVGLAQRLAFLLWFAWWGLASRVLTCTSASTAKS